MKAFVKRSGARTRTSTSPPALKAMLPWLTSHVEEAARSHG
jgi:hypothetical protein